MKRTAETTIAGSAPFQSSAGGLNFDWADGEVRQAAIVSAGARGVLFQGDFLNEAAFVDRGDLERSAADNFTVELAKADGDLDGFAVFVA